MANIDELLVGEPPIAHEDDLRTDRVDRRPEGSDASQVGLGRRHGIGGGPVGHVPDHLQSVSGVEARMSVIRAATGPRPTMIDRCRTSPVRRARLMVRLTTARPSMVSAMADAAPTR